mgnify:CR=1 FL=1
MERYEAYKDSGVEWIGEIPEGWNAIAAKRYTRISNGSDPTTEGDIPVYGSSGIAFKTCGESKQAPAVLLGRKGTIESPSYIDHPYWNVDTAFDVKTDEEVLSLRYYFYLATCFDYARYQTSTAVPSMTQTDYGNMRIPVPTAIEQQAIADYLGAKTAEIDALVADCEREVGLLQEYRKAVISEAVTKGLDPDAPMKDSGVEWIGAYPTTWQYLRLGYTFDRLFDIDHWMPETVDEGYPYLMIGDLENLASRVDFDSCKHISEEDYLGLAVKGTPKRGDVIIARYATIGTGCYVDTDEHFIVTYACLTVTPKHEAMRGRYLLYYTQSDAFERELYTLTNSNTQGNVGKDSLSKAHILLPPVEEQNEIISALDSHTSRIDELIDAKQSMADKLREYRRSLISEAVTGKFKVPGV